MDEAPRPSKAARWAVRLVVWSLIPLVIVLVWLMQPRQTPEKVARMIASQELVGVPIEEAARLLHHELPRPIESGELIFDFSHLQDWKGGVVRIEVSGGTVAAATYEVGGE